MKLLKSYLELTLAVQVWQWMWCQSSQQVVDGMGFPGELRGAPLDRGPASGPGGSPDRSTERSGAGTCLLYVLLVQLLCGPGHLRYSEQMQIVQ